MSIYDFNGFLKNINSGPLRVLYTAIPNNKYVPLDLSESNKLLNAIDVSSSEKLGAYVNNHIKTNGAQVAFGGYLEVRNIYKRSNHFNKQAQEERNIHLGIDLWCTAETPIYAPLDATVHSFRNNTNYGDYGPTIILKHHISGIEFYTLYGHLSLASIQHLEVGQTFKQGNKIATLGKASVNGDYPPHLHFQVIKDIQDYQGDYPGVCSKTDFEFYKSNCPNPNLLLKL
ncbi:Peptidase family M23 [Flaviramulus basaltis]|uniref:Peptidase family M23 n=1 Tax=Flaviramulus basaltis TaxID=369401 RepID=A0A1K2IMV3_9FLAO|nr:peptidoglycan DD-metalloendopeptidase family protein [Flaviramulus basaltis]SFZ93003.1 Peptidase family M23 [Flaviramulus basaltis]